MQLVFEVRACRFPLVGDGGTDPEDQACPLSVDIGAVVLVTENEDVSLLQKIQAIGNGGNSFLLDPEYLDGRAVHRPGHTFLLSLSLGPECHHDEYPDASVVIWMQLDYWYGPWANDPNELDWEHPSRIDYWAIVASSPECAAALIAPSAASASERGRQFALAANANALDDHPALDGDQ